MLVIVVALFAICWLPLQTYNVLQDIFPQINGYRYINIIWFCCDWLAMSNSCYNPFIYGIYNEKFKREFKQRFPFRHRNWSPSPATESIELDKTPTLGTRASLRYNNYDWRRAYSARAQQQYNTQTPPAPLNGAANNFYRGVSVRAPTRRFPADGDNEGVATEVYVFPGSRIKSSDIHSSMEELCL